MEVGRVRALIASGLSYSQIGKLCGGKSRCAVAGFVRRHIKGIKDDQKKKETLDSQSRPSRRKPSMPYVPGVTEDGKKWIDVDEELERRKEAPKDGDRRDEEARAR